MVVLLEYLALELFEFELLNLLVFFFLEGVQLCLELAIGFLKVCGIGDYLANDCKE